MKFPYEWTLENAVFTKDKGTVFSCFSCGGGSTMGYKLAGFDVIGCNEIDPKLMKAYVKNHNPKYSYLEPIQEFKNRKDLPQELFELDILDGSPPCSSFSMSGNREQDWGKEKKFREGQSEQVLDTLFFDFIDLAKRLQPKVVVAENVKGLMMGSAIEYVRRIYHELEQAGYYVQHWLLNASKMGVPQRRERVFFIALRNDLAPKFLKQMDLFAVAPELNLEFNERPIPFKEIMERTDLVDLTDRNYDLWQKCEIGKSISTVHPTGAGFNCVKQDPDRPLNTLAAELRINNTNTGILHPFEPRQLTKREFMLGTTYPLDYDFISDAKTRVGYLCGMSVPPVMVAQIATRIYEQWLSKI